ncbi:hypothetical protein M2326_002372 [Flavobacterium sp. 7A]|nr:hypothetical protein [Flavobacterium sp. 7A]MCW2120056.1 hypothetical protein [Flavobacterium sp. 7A]
MTERTLACSDVVETVGLLIDEDYFLEKNKLIEEIISKGILKENIKVLVYKNRATRKEGKEYSVCTPNNLNWKAEINNKAVADFVNTDFDLLINYYDVEKAVLLVITHQSKAHFKVGFSSIDKRLNDLTVTINADNHQVFIHEMFRYLKILNKI